MHFVDEEALFETLLCILCNLIGGGTVIIRVSYVVSWRAESPVNPYKLQSHCQEVAASSFYCSLYIL